MSILPIMFSCAEPLLEPLLTFEGSIWNLNQPLLFSRRPTSRASSLLQQRTSLRVVKRVFKKAIVTFIPPRWFFPLIITLLELLGKLRQAFYLQMEWTCVQAPATPFQAFACHLLLPPKANTQDGPQGHVAEVQAVQTIKPALKQDQCTLILFPSSTINPVKVRWTYSGP